MLWQDNYFFANKDKKIIKKADIETKKSFFALTEDIPVLKS